jgi:hypothetical protein
VVLLKSPVCHSIQPVQPRLVCHVEGGLVFFPGGRAGKLREVAGMDRGAVLVHQVQVGIGGNFLSQEGNNGFCSY